MRCSVGWTSGAACMPAEPGPRTDIAYPVASDLDAAERKRLRGSAARHGRRLREAVMVGGQAMFAARRIRRALRRDARPQLGRVVGPRRRVRRRATWTAGRGFIRELNRVTNACSRARSRPGRCSPSAPCRRMVHADLAASGAEVSVAMDNCANLLVLYGTRARHRRRAGASSPKARSAWRCHSTAATTTRLRPPSQPSSTTRSRSSSVFKGPAVLVRFSGPDFPTAPAAVRKLAAAQWSSTVRFRGQSSDGPMAFAASSIGPSANLTAFLGDILADQPHLALATNVRRKHGLEQLLATVDPALRPRPRRRSGAAVRRTNLASPPIDLRSDAAPRRTAALLDNTMPTLRLSDDDRAAIRRLAAEAADRRPTAAVAPPAASRRSLCCERRSVRHRGSRGGAGSTLRPDAPFPRSSNTMCSRAGATATARRR